MKMTEHLMENLKLIDRTPTSNDGWASCSDKIFEQLISKTPDELVMKRIVGETHLVKLTTEAAILLHWMA